MKRLDDWEARLLEYIERKREAPFALGTHDCCAFVRGALEAMTGVDPCPDLVWSTEEEADALLAQGLEAIVSRYLGPAVPVLCVRRGGVLLLDHGRGLGLKLGSRGCVPGDYEEYDEQREDFEFAGLQGRAVTLYRRQRTGLVFLPLERFSRGWNV